MPGIKPKNKVKIKWSPRFAYGIGLITTDGNLSLDKRHLNFTSRDKEQTENFKKIFDLSNKIGRKSREQGKERKYFVIQFGDVNFYKFLLKIGLMPNKSKILGDLEIPGKYFADFLRGHFDGDGRFYSYFDKRWRSSFMFYCIFSSASEKHILWLQRKIKEEIKIHGAIKKLKHSGMFNLSFAKKESLKLIKFMYYNEKVICLSRKKHKVALALKQNN